MFYYYRYIYKILLDTKVYEFCLIDNRYTNIMEAFVTEI
jgi:hypothetical protein